MEQIVDSVPVVPFLHISEPQTVDSVVEVWKILDKSLPDVEQVIEVPKIFLDVLPASRAAAGGTAGVRITAFSSAIVIDVIVHCHTAGAL